MIELCMMHLNEDNSFGTKGARMLSEALKTNSTLALLNFWGEQDDKQNDEDRMIFRLKRRRYWR